MKKYFKFKQMQGIKQMLIAGVGVSFLFPSATFSKKTEEKNTSSFPANAAGKPLRDPFWPVGYFPEGWGAPKEEKKPEKKSEDEEKKRLELLRQQELKRQQEREAAINKGWNLAMKKIKINGVSSSGDGEFVAIINDDLKAIGDTVMVQQGNVKYFWSIVEIRPPQSVKFLRVRADAEGNVSVNVD